MLRALPRSVTRPLSYLLVAAWAAQMALLVNRSYLQASSLSLGADLARYGSAAQWKGVYYRGEKIGFVVGQTIPLEDGYELQEDGELLMTLLGSSSAARIRTAVRVERDFSLRSFTFSLDPGTGPIQVEGTLQGRLLELRVTTSSGTRTESRELPEAPLLALNLSRRLAAAGLAAGDRHRFTVFDPATLRNAPLVLEVKGREVVRAAGRPVPAFRVDMTFEGVSSSSWITDTGEVVREESALGLVVVKETRERAIARTVPGDVRTDMLQAAAVVPNSRQRIDDPATVDRLQLRLEGATVSGPELQGAGQTVAGDVITIEDSTDRKPGAPDPEAGRFLDPEPLIESDAPEIVAEATHALQGVRGSRARAERLVRHVNALLEKKPTVSIPSAREVLRTRIGDCNEHTALYVAMARASGIPARVAVGLVYLRGAFYYHAWPEVHLEEGGRGLWLPVDPTLNQFPADATHLRLARGGLDRQAAILPLVGKLKMTILEVKAKPGSVPVLVGREAPESRPLDPSIPRRGGGGRRCWSSVPR